jgi:hypothetical protein
MELKMQPGKRNVITVPRDIHQKMKVVAAVNQTSVTQITKEVLSKYLDEEIKKPGMGQMLRNAMFRETED